jgi:hypothetical protein
VSGSKLSEDRIQYLQMIQAAITRMAGAAATMKNLCLIVVAGALAFVATSKNPSIAFFAAFLAGAFWFLDARYLQQEKWFRDMYDGELDRDASEPATFVMTPSKEIRAATDLQYGLKSWSTWGLYGPVIVFLLILWLVLVCTPSTPS